ncbi:MAG: beta-galactosidase [Candidatus Sericytochromatia bacterium]
MKKVEIQDKKVLIDGKEGIIYGGEFQYFRIPKSTWETSLQYLKNANINLISFYIPWIWHEVEENKFDFTGETFPERDIAYFLKLCEKFEFNVMARPGPYIYAEYQGFGLPEWVREKHPEILIHYEDGTKSHEVSLNHPVYLDYVKKWYKAIFNILKPYYENNMIFAWQLDNETGLPQFGNVPFMSDINPDTIEKFKIYCEKRFGDIKNINKVLRTDYKSRDEIYPPKKGKGNKFQVRIYGEFIEDYIVDYLDTLKGFVLDLGIKPFFYLNDPYLCHWPHHSVKKSRVAPVGYDTYPKFSTSKETHDLPFCVSYATEFFHSIHKNQPTIGAEVGCGWFDPRVKVNPEATLQLSMVSLIRNTNILAYYLLQDCLEHDGYEWLFQSPLDIKGQPTARYDVLKQVGTFVKEHGHLLCQSKEIYSDVGLGIYIPHVRDMIKSNINYWSVLEEINKATLHFNGHSSIMGVLTECGFNPVINDLELMSYEEMKKLKVLFIFSTGHLDKASHDKILKYVYEGGVLITIGYPITEYDSGEKIENNPLYPAEPFSNSNVYHFGTTNLATQAGYDVVSYQWSRRQIKHKQSLHTIDMLQPMGEVIKYLGKMGAWINNERGGKLWSSRYVSTWKSGKGITPLLRYNDMTVSYSARYGHGKSIFVGTLLGIFYDSPAYYKKEQSKKDSIIDFVYLILKEAGLKPIHNKTSNIEVIIRELKDSMLVFLVNRGSERNYCIELDTDFYENIKVIFTSKNSTINENEFIEHRILKGFLEKDDVLGLHIY